METYHVWASAGASERDQNGWYLSQLSRFKVLNPRKAKQVGSKWCGLMGAWGHTNTLFVNLTKEVGILLHLIKTITNDLFLDYMIGTYYIFVNKQKP